MSGLTTSLRWMTPSRRPPSARPSGVPPERAMRSTAARNAGGSATPPPAGRAGELQHGIDGALAQLAAVEIDAGQPRRRRERDEARDCGGEAGMAARYFSCASATIERPSGVSSARLASSAASAASRSETPGHRDDLGRHAVAEGDGAGLVEQQRVDVAGRLDRAARHGEHVELEQAVHAGDADGRQQAADGGRDQRHEQRDQHRARRSSCPE